MRKLPFDVDAAVQGVLVTPELVEFARYADDATLKLSLYGSDGNTPSEGIHILFDSEDYGVCFEALPLIEMIEHATTEKNISEYELEAFDPDFETKHAGYHEKVLNLWKSAQLLKRMKLAIDEWREDEAALTYDDALARHNS